MASLTKQLSPSRGRATLGGGGGGWEEEVQERAQHLVTERQALREVWEKRNRKLKQCCELQVYPQTYILVLAMYVGSILALHEIMLLLRMCRRLGIGRWCKILFTSKLKVNSMFA